jgi:hypothetical protein
VLIQPVDVYRRNPGENRPPADIAGQSLESREGGPVEQDRVGPLPGNHRRHDGRQITPVALDQRGDDRGSHLRLVGQQEYARASVGGHGFQAFA